MEAEVQGAGLVDPGNIRYPRPHSLNGVEHGIAFLYGHPVNAVCIVAGPHLVKVSDGSQVAPTAAGGTAFKLHSRVTALQFVYDPVHCHGMQIRIHFGIRQIFRSHLGERPVHIPLDIADIVIRQQPIQAI